MSVETWIVVEMVKDIGLGRVVDCRFVLRLRCFVTTTSDKSLSVSVWFAQKTLRIVPIWKLTHLVWQHCFEQFSQLSCCQHRCLIVFCASPSTFFDDRTKSINGDVCYTRKNTRKIPLESSIISPKKPLTRPRFGTSHILGHSELIFGVIVWEMFFVFFGCFRAWTSYCFGAHQRFLLKLFISISPLSCPNVFLFSLLPSSHPKK